jgi:aspartyl-tRNA(Asn)/glutamyl-tRNA(Gln) amidotransferase subunit A
MDHVGAMANCVRDLAYIFEVIAGYDPNDQKCAHLAVRGFDPEWQKPQSIARLGGMFHDGADPASSQKLLSFFRVQPGGVSPIWGTAISDVPPPAELAEVTRRHNTVMAVEAAAFHATRLAHHPEDYPPKITALLREGLNTPAPNYAECKSHQDQLSLICDNLLESFDALVTLATPGPAPTADTTGNPVFNSPWSYTGLPTISLPFAWSPDGLPLAIQLIGPRFREQEIFSIAAGWESREFEFERRPLPL